MHFSYLELVKKKLAILLASVYLFGATDAGQLLKLPLLISHYIKHKEENPQTTLISFFKMHYVDPQPYDADYAQDMQLPFKTLPKAFFRYTPSVASPSPFIKPKVFFANNEIPPVSNESITPFLVIHKIFQPPRV